MLVKSGVGVMVVYLRRTEEPRLDTGARAGTLTYLNDLLVVQEILRHSPALANLVGGAPRTLIDGIAKTKPC